VAQPRTPPVLMAGRAPEMRPGPPPVPAAHSLKARFPDVNCLTVPGRPEQVAVAREFVAEMLGRDHPLADTAVLLTSELVTNSLRHSASSRDGGSVTVALTHPVVDSGLLRVEVADDGARGLPTRRTAGPEDESGYGLQLVDVLATRWGYCRESGGATTTWFEIAS
jgi:anti-sigma regulatory factor (Ser/Thr protein kinase)